MQRYKFESARHHTRLWLIWLIMLQNGSALVNSTYQGVTNACGQNMIYVNGNFHPTCVNGYLDSNNNYIPYMVPRCQANYTLVNGFCYPEQQLPQYVCPNGFYFSGGLCYPMAAVKCHDEHTTQAPPSIPPEIPELPKPEHQTQMKAQPQPTLVPPPQPQPLPQLQPAPLTRCPPDSVLHENVCRKIVCSRGEYYYGRCLKPACPEGTVWRNHRCQQPQFVRTLLEFNNVFTNEERDDTQLPTPQNVNNVQYHQLNAELNTTTQTVSSQTKLYSTTSTTPAPAVRLTKTPNPSHGLASAALLSSKPTNQRPLPNTTLPNSCCNLLTPRVCKQYGARWVCFNHRYKRCDAQLCRSSLVYLKVPEIYYKPPILVMPPNPSLMACPKPGCDESETVDCSGCADGRRESCSPYCYHYMCPSGTCNYLDLQTYCTTHAGGVGCTKADGCYWDWCGS